MDGCHACRRTVRVVSACESLNQLVDVVVRRLGDSDVTPPEAVIGGPTIVFRGTVVSLGTPDCKELTGKVSAMLAAAR